MYLNCRGVTLKSNTHFGKNRKYLSITYYNNPLLLDCIRARELRKLMNKPIANPGKQAYSNFRHVFLWFRVGRFILILTFISTLRDQKRILPILGSTVNINHKLKNRNYSALYWPLTWIFINLVKLNLCFLIKRVFHVCGFKKSIFCIFRI